MKSMGVKSLAWIFVTLLALFLFLFVSDWTLQSFLEVDPRVVFAAGVMSVMLTGLVLRSTNPTKQSVFRVLIHKDGIDAGEVTPLFKIKDQTLSVAKNKDFHKAFELKYVFQLILAFTTFCCISLMVFGTREISLLETVPRALSIGGFRYCPDQEGEEVDAAQRPECQLILRAFQLGYAKDLGKCGRSQEGAPQMCELRQKDEPYFHFAYRRLKGTYESVAGFIKKSKETELKIELKKDIDRYQPLVKKQLAEVNGSPRSSHFILTNLPSPTPKWKKVFNDYFNPDYCEDHFSKIPNRGPEQTQDKFSSHVFEYATGHLLFDPSYRPVVSSCREFTYVWNASFRDCQMLKQDSKAILKKYGLERKVKGLVDRYKNQKSLLAEGEKIEPIGKVVSFNCFIYEDQNNSLVKNKFKYEGLDFPLRQLKMTTADTERYFNIRILTQAARLLVNRFRYDSSLVEGKYNDYDNLKVSEELFNEPDYRLSRIGYLNNTDIFLGHSWLHLRPDLLEVYPFYLHLSQYVESFREAYKEQRGRM